MNTALKACAVMIAAGGIALSATSASALEPRSASTPSSVAVTGNTQTPINLATKAVKQKKIVVAGRRRGRRGAAIGLGIIAGVATAAILSSRAHARGRHYDDDYSYRRSRHYNRCERWEYRCHELGVRRACRKFYNRCR